jgi:hypothetical protein
MPMPAARPVVPDSPPHRGPRVEQLAILARTRCSTAARSQKPEVLGQKKPLKMITPIMRITSRRTPHGLENGVFGKKAGEKLRRIE